MLPFRLSFVYLGVRVFWVRVFECACFVGGLLGVYVVLLFIIC